jgi:tyrosine-protein phosphatase SIW14
MNDNTRLCRIVLGIVLSLILSLAGAATDSPAKPTGCENNLGSPILNFCEVTPGILWRGSRPDKDGTAWLIQQGVRTIANLELLHDGQQTIEQVRLDNKGKYQLGYYRIRDWESLPAIAQGLSDDYLAMFLAIVQAAPKPVYVHCRSGQNRTGLMVAAYRVIVEGEGKDNVLEAAIHEMESYGILV